MHPISLEGLLGQKRALLRTKLNELVENLVSEELYMTRMEAIRALDQELKCIKSEQRGLMLLMVRGWGESMDLGLLAKTGERKLSDWAWELSSALKVTDTNSLKTSEDFQETTSMSLGFEQGGQNCVINLTSYYENHEMDDRDFNSLADINGEHHRGEEEEDEDEDDDDGDGRRQRGRRRRIRENEVRDHAPAAFGDANETIHLGQVLRGTRRAFVQENEEEDDEDEDEEEEEEDEDNDGEDFADDEYDDDREHMVFDGENEEGHDDGDEDEDDDDEDEDEDDDDGEEEAEVDDNSNKTRVEFVLRAEKSNADNGTARTLVKLAFTTCKGHCLEPVLYEDEGEGKDDEEKEPGFPDFFTRFESTGTGNAYGPGDFNNLKEKLLMWAFEGRPPKKAGKTTRDSFRVEDQWECNACMAVHGFRCEVNWEALYHLTDDVQAALSVPINPPVLRRDELRITDVNDELFRFVRGARILAFFLVFCAGSSGYAMSPVDALFGTLLGSGLPLISGARMNEYLVCYEDSDGSLGVD